MSRTVKILIVAVAAIILVIGVIFAVRFFFGQPAQPTPVAQEMPEPSSLTPSSGLATSPGTTTAVVETTPPVVSEPPRRASPEAIARSQIKTTSAQFAERFGSYSSQGNFQNLIDLKPVMTMQMQRTVDDTIESASESGVPEDYVGVTTQAIATKIVTLNMSGGRAETTVDVQRLTRTDQDTVGKTSLARLVLTLEKVDDDWKVDTASWEDI